MKKVGIEEFKAIKTTGLRLLVGVFCLLTVEGLARVLLLYLLALDNHPSILLLPLCEILEHACLALTSHVPELQPGPRQPQDRARHGRPPARFLPH
jgi:hypothetical protein